MTGENEHALLNNGNGRWKGDNKHKKGTPTHRQHPRHPQKATQKPRRPTDLFFPSFTQMGG